CLKSIYLSFDVYIFIPLKYIKFSMVGDSKIFPFPGRHFTSRYKKKLFQPSRHALNYFLPIPSEGIPPFAPPEVKIFSLESSTPTPRAIKLRSPQGLI